VADSADLELRTLQARFKRLPSRSLSDRLAQEMDNSPSGLVRAVTWRVCGRRERGTQRRLLQERCLSEQALSRVRMLGVHVCARACFVCVWRRRCVRPRRVTSTT
jgi:hypothetical protein